jgi:hypothetical protein
MVIDMINVWIDKFTPCLVESLTGDIVQTEVVRLRRKSFLKKYSKRTGWYVNWADLLDDNEIYALVVEGTVDIQGLVALKNVRDYGAVLVSWMVSAPYNNKQLLEQEQPRYLGVGGHLFAIAAQKSVEYGYEGVITGNAANKELVRHYCEVFQADLIGVLHPFQIMIGEKAASEIMEVYDYEWTDDEL